MSCFIFTKGGQISLYTWSSVVISTTEVIRFFSFTAIVPYTVSEQQCEPCCLAIMSVVQYVIIKVVNRGVQFLSSEIYGIGGEKVNYKLERRRHGMK